MTTVQSTFGNRIEQAECRNNGAGWQYFNFQFAAGHVIDLRSEIYSVFVEDVFRRPGRLEAHILYALRFRNHWEAKGSCTGATNSSTFQKLTTWCLVFHFRHSYLLVLINQVLRSNDFLKYKDLI